MEKIPSRILEVEDPIRNYSMKMETALVERIALTEKIQFTQSVILTTYAMR